MKITICCSATNPLPWLHGLQAALPQAQIKVWPTDAQELAAANPADAADAKHSHAADYAVVWAPPQAFLDAQTGLKALFNIGAGVDALLRLRLPAQTQVVRLDDAGMSVQMAEYVCHALIRHFRDFDGYAADSAQGRWSYRKPRLRAEFPVGILGLGVLGQRVAQALQQFEFPLNGWSRTARTIAGVRCFSGAAELPDFLSASRALVCLLPLTPETENILNHANLSRLQTGAYLVNVARGAHLVEADLLALLASGQLAGATLDVFRTEPLPAAHPFWQQAQISVTPHTSARTLRDESIAQIVGKIAALERGEPIAGVVDRTRGY